MSLLKYWSPDIVISQSYIAIVLQITILLTLLIFFIVNHVWPVQQWSLYLALLSLMFISVLRLFKRFRVQELRLRAIEGVWQLTKPGAVNEYSCPEYRLEKQQLWPFVIVLKLSPLEGGFIQKTWGGKTLMIFRDSTDADTFRRLKIYLRFGKGFQDQEAK